MRQLVELREQARALKKAGGRVRTVAVLLQPKNDTGVGKSGFRGPVIDDRKKSLANQLGAGVGSVMIFDREGRLRCHKPGTKMKRARCEIVVHALAAIAEQDREPQAVEAARSQLESTAAKDRKKALSRLAELEALTARSDIQQILTDDPDPTVRIAAAQALRIMRDEDSIPALSKAIQTETDPKARAEIARTLGDFGNDYMGFPSSEFRPNYVHASKRELSDAQASVEEAALFLFESQVGDERSLGAHLLRRMEDTVGKARFLEFVDDPEEGVRFAALSALATTWFRDEDVIAAAKGHLRDSKRNRALAEFIVNGPIGKVRQ